MNSCINIRNFNAWYGEHKVLSDVNIDIEKNKITAFIGPSGCGKTTLLKTINRMNDLVSSFRMEGSVLLDNENIYGRNIDVRNIRRRVGMVFQQPNVFPMSVYNNLKLPIKENLGHMSSKETLGIIEEKLKMANLFDEIKDRLKSSALNLSGGQQQRLCIARALTIEPEVILFDEPCSALDPISTLKIEDLLTVLKEKYTIVIVTHNLQQASRISDYVAFFYCGRIEEQGYASDFFLNPKTKLAHDYIIGKF